MMQSEEEVMAASNQPGKIACPHCQAMIKAPAIAAGSLVNCPKCGQGFRLGEGSVPARRDGVQRSAEENAKADESGLSQPPGE